MTKNPNNPYKVDANINADKLRSLLSKDEYDGIRSRLEHGQKLYAADIFAIFEAVSKVYGEDWGRRMKILSSSSTSYASVGSSAGPIEANNVSAYGSSNDRFDIVLNFKDVYGPTSTWLSPAAKNIKTAVLNIFPDLKDQFKNAFTLKNKELADLHRSKYDKMYAIQNLAKSIDKYLNSELAVSRDITPVVMMNAYSIMYDDLKKTNPDLQKKIFGNVNFGKANLDNLKISDYMQVTDNLNKNFTFQFNSAKYPAISTASNWAEANIINSVKDPSYLQDYTNFLSSLVKNHEALTNLSNSECISRLVTCSLRTTQWFEQKNKDSNLVAVINEFKGKYRTGTFYEEYSEASQENNGKAVQPQNKKDSSINKNTKQTGNTGNKADSSKKTTDTDIKQSEFDDIDYKQDPDYKKEQEKKKQGNAFNGIDLGNINIGSAVALADEGTNNRIIGGKLKIPNDNIPPIVVT